MNDDFDYLQLTCLLINIVPHCFVNITRSTDIPEIGLIWILCRFLALSR
jgi:hypothetical protein